MDDALGNLQNEDPTVLEEYKKTKIERMDAINAVEKQISSVINLAEKETKDLNDEKNKIYSLLYSENNDEEEEEKEKEKKESLKERIREINDKIQKIDTDKNAGLKELINIRQSYNVIQAGGKRKSKANNKKVAKKPVVSQKKQSECKEILGKKMKIYKMPDSRKEYVKYKGELLHISDYKNLMKQKAIAKTKTKPNATQQKAIAKTKTKK
jgi:hypothetical protein